MSTWIQNPFSGGGGGGGSGTVTSVTAADTSIVVTGTPTVAPTLATNTLDVIAADHPPAADWSNNSHKITGLANGAAASDAAAFGQIPTALPPNGPAGGTLGGTYPNPSLAAPLIAGLQLIANAAATTPLLFASGTLNSTPTAGAEEYDGTAFYATAAGSSRQVVDTEQIEILSGVYTLANNTSLQALLNATVNGALTVQGSTTYLFECLISGSGFSGSAHNFNFALGGTATYTSVLWKANSVTSAAGAGAMTAATSAAAAALLSATTTNTSLFTDLRGVMRINAAGTVIPQIQQVTASAAASINANTYFRCWPIGSNVVTNVGNWS